MARVKVVRTVNVRGRGRVKVKQFELTRLTETTVDVYTTTQMRVLAEETRELILDRMFMQRPQAPGAARVPRPAQLKRPRIPTATRGAATWLRKLKPATVKRKAQRGLDGRKLIETGALANAIIVRRGTNKGLPYYQVGIKRGRHPNTGHGPQISYLLLAFVHELGSAAANVPPRPVWGPTSRELADVFKSLRYQKRIKAELLREALRKVT